MVFVKKWRFINLLFLCKIGQENMFFEGSDRKEAFLDQKNIGSKNHENFLFFKGVSRWFLSKIGDFLISQFLCKMDQEKVFCEVFGKKRSLFRL